MDRKLIPGTKGFYINTKGEVFGPNGKVRKTYTNGDGYITSSVKLVNNKWVTYGVHRLNALTHLKSISVEETEVNHRDLDITNNDIKNLEYTTPYQNNIHYEIMQINKNYDCLYSMIDGVPHKKYNNAHVAAKVENCEALDIWDSVKNNTVLNGKRYYFRPRRKSMPPELMYDRSTNFRSNSRQPPKKIKMLDVDTGKVLRFDSLLEAGRYFGVSASHIYQSIPKGNNAILFHKRYQVQYSGVNFPVLSMSELKNAKDRGNKEVLAYNFKSGGFSIYKSAAEYIRYTGLSKKAVTVSLRNNTLRVIGVWVALYLTDENKKLLQSYVSSPVE